MILILIQDTLITDSFLLSMPLLNEVIIHQLSISAFSTSPEPTIIRSLHRGPYWIGISKTITNTKRRYLIHKLSFLGILWHKDQKEVGIYFQYQILTVFCQRHFPGGNMIQSILSFYSKGRFCEQHGTWQTKDLFLRSKINGQGTWQNNCQTIIS